MTVDADILGAARRRLQDLNTRTQCKAMYPDVCRCPRSNIVSRALVRVAAEFVLFSRGQVLYVPAVLSSVKDVQDAEIDDDSGVVLLRAIVHCSLQHLLSEEDVIQAYPNALKMLLTGVRVDESARVVQHRATASIFLGDCARTKLVDGPKAMAKKVANFVVECPIEDLIADLYRLSKSRPAADYYACRKVCEQKAESGAQTVLENPKAENIKDLQRPPIKRFRPKSDAKSTADDEAVKKARIQEKKEPMPIPQGTARISCNNMANSNVNGREISSAQSPMLVDGKGSKKDLHSTSLNRPDHGRLPSSTVTRERENGDARRTSGKLAFRGMFERQSNETTQKQPDNDSLRPLKCAACDARFLLKGELEAHIGAAHKKKEKRFKCVLCDARFTRRSTCNRHIRTIHQMVPPHQRWAPVDTNPKESRRSLTPK